MWNLLAGNQCPHEIDGRRPRTDLLQVYGGVANIEELLIGRDLVRAHLIHAAFFRPALRCSFAKRVQLRGATPRKTSRISSACTEVPAAASAVPMPLNPSTCQRRSESQ